MYGRPELVWRAPVTPAATGSEVQSLQERASSSAVSSMRSLWSSATDPVALSAHLVTFFGALVLRSVHKELHVANVNMRLWQQPTPCAWGSELAKPLRPRGGVVRRYHCSLFFSAGELTEAWSWVLMGIALSQVLGGPWHQVLPCSFLHVLQGLESRLSDCPPCQLTLLLPPVSGHQILMYPKP